jgi:hypothetical protein
MMIDILTIQKGDIIEYGPYRSSASLEHTRSYGIYQDFMWWSPDERPLELWVNFLKLWEPSKLVRFCRASQIIRTWPSAEYPSWLQQEVIRVESDNLE